MKKVCHQLVDNIQLIVAYKDLSVFIYIFRWVSKKKMFGQIWFLNNQQIIVPLSNSIHEGASCIREKGQCSKWRIVNSTRLPREQKGFIGSWKLYLTLWPCKWRKPWQSLLTYFLHSDYGSWKHFLLLV